MHSAIYLLKIKQTPTYVRRANYLALHLTGDLLIPSMPIHDYPFTHVKKMTPWEGLLKRGKEVTEPCSMSHSAWKGSRMTHLCTVSQFRRCSHQHDTARLWLPTEGSVLSVCLASPRLQAELGMHSRSNTHNCLSRKKTHLFQLLQI